MNLILFPDRGECSEDDTGQAEEKVVERVEVVSDGAELRVHELALHLVAGVGGASVSGKLASFNHHTHTLSLSFIHSEFGHYSLRVG